MSDWGAEGYVVDTPDDDPRTGSALRAMLEASGALPYHDEIQAAKRRVVLAMDDDTAREALEDLRELARARRERLERGEAA